MNIVFLILNIYIYELRIIVRKFVGCENSYDLFYLKLFVSFYIIEVFIDINYIKFYRR